MTDEIRQIIEQAFREGYQEGYRQGGNDCARFECGGGSTHEETQKRDQGEAWEFSEAKEIATK